MAVYLGIDPGSTGALCFLDSETKQMKFMPTPCLECSPETIRNTIVNAHTNHGLIMAGIEDVHAIHGAAAGSSFKFGFNVGILHGIVRSTSLGLELITPKEWQRTIKAPSKKRAGGATGLKKAIAEIALRLYPNAQLFGPRGGLKDGRADALMIAHHLLLKYGGTS